MNSKHLRWMLWGVSGLLLVAVIAVVVYKALPLLNPELAEIAPLDPQCDLRAGPCSARLPGGGEVRFQLLPDDIPLLKPLQIEVELEGIAASAAEVDFKGISMNMGYNRPMLQPAAAGQFRGTTTLPVCVRNAMEWEATVLIHSDRGLLAAPFRFITVKP